MPGMPLGQITGPNQFDSNKNSASFRFKNLKIRVAVKLWIIFNVSGILLIVDANDFVKNQIRSTPFLSTYDENLLKNLIKVSAGFAFLNALLFAAEGILTFKYQDDL